jgi:hypothetical protein
MDIKEFKCPEGFKLVKIEDPKDNIRKEIEQLEQHTLKEPTDEELIMEGKMTHPYYMNKQRIEDLKRLLE